MGGHKEQSCREDRWMGEGGGEAGGAVVGGLNEIGAGLGLRRGERRGKKKEEAAPGDKGREAWGPGRERARAAAGKGGFQPGWQRRE